MADIIHNPIIITPEARIARIDQLQKECQEEEVSLEEKFKKFCEENSCFPDIQIVQIHSVNGIQIDQASSGVKILSNKRAEIYNLILDGKKK